MRLKEKAKRVLATVMALSMMFSSMSTAVFATGTEPTPPEGELIVEQTQQSAVTVNWGETPAESISPSLTLSFTTGAEGETPVVQELTAEENWTATYQLPYSETAYTLTVSGVPEGFAAAVSAVEGGYAVSIAAVEAQQQSEEQPETPTSDPVQELYDTLMAFESYDELSDYMDNMTEEQYALLSQFSEEQTAALQAHTQTLSENAQEMLPEVNETELNKVKRELPNKLMQHLDVRLPGATITITTELVDYISGTTISTGVPRTIAAQVNQVHSITLTNFYRYTRYGTQWENSYTYTDFERNVDAVIENRQNTNFYVTQNTTATVTVDLIDNDDNIYENVVLTYNYDGIARAAMNCDTYVKYDGSYYGGLDFNPATNTEFTSRYINYVIPVVKVWNDTGYEHLRPDDLTIKLQSSTSENGPWTDTGKTLTLNAANEWKGSFENLDYQNDSLQRIYYKVVEELPANSNYEQTGFDTIDDYIYVVGDNRPSIAAYRFTNTPTSVDIPVTKVWADNNNQDGKRTSVTIQLKNGNTVVDTVTLDGKVDTVETTAWHATFTGVDPSVKTYEVVETNVPEGYTVSYKYNKENIGAGVEVTNTLTPETVDITVNKVWKDKDGNILTTDIPDSMHFHLFKNGAMYGDEYVLSAANKWEVKIENLPKYEGGQAIVWTVGEHKVPALYEVVYTDNNTQKEMNRDAGIQITDNAGSVTITNTYDPNTKSIVVQKLWVGDEEHTDLRPASITVALYQKIGQDGEWKLYRNGESYEYGGEIIDVITTLNNVGDWRYRWPNLPTHHTSTVDYFYGVAEVEVKNGTVTVINDKLVDGLNGAKYEVGYENNSNTNNSDSDNDIGQATEGTVVITNTLKTRTLTVKKDWVGTIPSGSVTVDVYNSENEKVDTDGDSSNGITPLTLNASNSWEAITAALPANESYTVQETGAENGEVIIEGHTYTVSRSYNNANGIWTITNSEIIDIPVEKVWDDNSNDYGKRPASVTVQLLKDGTVVEGQTLTLSAANGWEDSFDNLPADGTYTIEEVVEDSWKDFYTSKVEGYTITNTINEDAVKVKLIINKTWYGDENKIDWSAVKFLVRQNGTLLTENEDYTVTTRPTSGTTGQFVIEGLPKYDSAGHEYIYTLREDTSGLEGWVVSSLVQTADTEHTYSLVNIQTMRIGLRKIWDDNNNQDGLRPDKLTFTLYQNDDLFYSGSIDVSGDVYENMWINLPRFDANGKEYTYTVAEEPVTGYTTVPAKLTGESSYNNVKYNNDRLTFNGIPYDVAYVAQFINTHNPETVSYNVYKTWIDNNNQDGKRPGSLSVGIFNGETLVQVVTLNHDNDWEGKFTNLPKYANGEEIKYSAYELVVDANGTYELDGVRYRKDTQGYTASGDGPVSGSINLTNTYTPATTAVTVTKVWEDANNQDGKRPASITVELLANGNAIQTVTLSANNNWTTTVDDLPVYANGQQITYTIKEVGEVNGTATLSGTEYQVTYSEDGKTVTNTHTPETTSITVNKVWDDQENTYRTRPDSITVNVKNGDTLAASVTLNAENNWTATVENLPKYANGVEIEYTVKEIVPAGYSESYNGTTITNTLQTIDIRGTKTWDDNNNQDGIRPSSIKVNLLANGTELKDLTVTPAPDGTWAFEFKDVPKYKDGELITYTVTEDEVAGYTPTVNGYNITNTHTPENVQIKVNKVWDMGTSGVSVPSHAHVQLVKNGEDYGGPVEVNSSNNWTYTWTVPKYDLGEEIIWTVREVFDNSHTIEVPTLADSNVVIKIPISNAFVFSHSREGNSITITNTFDLSHRSATVEKIWDDANDQDGKRPESIQVKLQYRIGDTGNFADVTSTVANGIFANVPGTVTLYETIPAEKVNDPAVGENWKYIWTALPQYENPNATTESGRGSQLQYQVVEVSVPDGYTVTYRYSGDENKDHLTSADNWAVEITNAYTPETYTQFTVTKKWEDNSNQDGKRPDTIILRLYETVDGVTTELSHVHLTTGQLVNTSYREAVETDRNTWTYTAGVAPYPALSLPKYKNGKEVTYTIKEEVPAGYSVKYGETVEMDDAAKVTFTDASGTAEVITNSYTPETTSVSGTKTWVDHDNKYGIRPESITVYLKNNVNTSQQSVPINAASEWKYSFTNLPKYANGVEIQYTVEETVPTGYSASYNSTNITNTLETIDIPTVTKIWNDNNNQDGIRPPSITVKVQYREKGSNDENAWADLTAAGTITLDKDSNSTTGFNDLPKYIKIGDAIKEVEYRVVETTVPDGYTASTKITDNGNAIITNTHTPETVSITVTKNWDDADDQDGQRPGSVTIHLMANGYRVTGVAKTLTKDGNWTATWDNLPKKANGVDIVYTVDEDSVAGYEKSYDYGKDNTSVAFTATPNSTDDYHGKVTVTNIHVPETITISGTKTWLDDDDQYGLRPSDAAIEVILQSGEEKKQAQQYQVDQDGNFVKDTDGYVLETVEPATANVANNWTYSFINLPKYEPDKVGVKIEYTVTDNVLNYTAEGGTVVGSSNDKQANLINRLTESVDLTVEKVWDDQDNKYGTRPDEITVTVKANGADLPKGGTITLDASNNWKHTFENLPKYSAENVEYEYTVVETAVTGYVPTYKQGENVLDSTDRIVFTNDAATVTVLNTLETIDIGNITNVGNAPAEKVWNDNDATEALRPDTITVKVFDGDEEVASQEVTDENATADGKTWRYEFLDLPKYKEVNGVKTEIAYTVKEILPQDYEDVYNTSNSGYVITNTPATVEIAVEKVWDTTNTALYDASVDSVVFKVLNGDTEVASVTLSEGKWKHTFTDLPKFEMKEGKPTEIAYKVVEEVVKGYEPSYTGADNDGVVTLTDVENSKNATGSVIIKNTLIENKISINKAWVGDRASWRPDDIDVNVVYNDKVVDTITLTEANNWTAEYTWYGSMEGLRFEEKDVPGSYISSKNNYPTLVGGTEYEVTITNTYYEYEPDEGDQIVVRKVWVGGDEENRPEVKIQLYKNGRKYRKEAELSESKHYSENWRYVWDDVTADKYTEWDVKEIDVPAGYVSTVTKVNDYYFIVTNTWVDEKPMPNTGK